MFKIGDRVTSKRTGLPITGTVVGVSKAETYMYLSKTQPGSYPTWSSLYPEWIDKAICIVESDTPQRACSFIEFMNNYIPGDEIEKRRLEIQYKVTVPIVPIISYPEDDLEIL